MILTNPNSGELYTIEDNTITNLTQGWCSKPKIEAIQGKYVIPTRLNHAAEQNPLILELVTTLGMALEY